MYWVAVAVVCIGGAVGYYVVDVGVCSGGACGEESSGISTESAKCGKVSPALVACGYGSACECSV